MTETMKLLRFAIPALGILICLSGTAAAQEKLIPLTSVAEMAAGQAPALKSMNQDTLELPFLDDFSGEGPWPSAALWSDRYVYVNRSFAVNPPTTGCATFDATDSTGAIYPSATVLSFLSDALTSRPINLFYPQDTTVYLSFYVQPQGYGDAPEPDDSLVVEFYAPDSRKWYRTWSSAGSELKDFRIVMINITDSRFLQKGFRFRFRNYASIAPAFDPSLKTNADQWNIDYVYLANGRHYDDTAMQDLAAVKPVGSLLMNHTAMPWQHFKAAGINSVRAIFQISLNNLSSDRRAFRPALKISPKWSNEAGFEQLYAEDEVKSFESLNYDAAFNYGFGTQDQDSALFEVMLDLRQPLPDRIPGNDSVISEQRFTDYYAYDDGTAEAGYGLTGEGTKNARLACRFTNFYPEDSLRAVDFCFNRSFGDASRKYFRLAIWADDNNKPGELIYVQEGSIPRYSGINGFQRIELDTAQAVGGKFYVGWIQTTSDFLNLGFDRQNNHQQDIFYHIGSTWQSTSFEGSLMIRPVFANKSRKSGTGGEVATVNGAQGIRIYPVPASGSITADPGQLTERFHAAILGLNGQVLREFQGLEGTSRLDISDIPEGLYLIRLMTLSGATAVQKLIILHE